MIQKNSSLMSEQDKQLKPLAGEVDPKEAKTKVFLAMQKAKNKIKQTAR
ncbi:hypothetical protein [Thalassolituus marinus]|uniref:Uncharacterized protein n=1 Tax=Thalassolituus marinus TaxID=671053 RepID=A0ABS7ZMK6_9GAMM|nr:hypothetical protein [Thalassolituus marinus]MCA6062935.1 hypothetical protein [Thalassolituus marinus]